MKSLPEFLPESPVPTDRLPHQDVYKRSCVNEGTVALRDFDDDEGLSEFRYFPPCDNSTRVGFRLPKRATERARSINLPENGACDFCVTLAYGGTRLRTLGRERGSDRIGGREVTDARLELSGV